MPPDVIARLRVQVPFSQGGTSVNGELGCIEYKAGDDVATVVKDWCEGQEWEPDDGTIAQLTRDLGGLVLAADIDPGPTGPQPSWNVAAGPNLTAMFGKRKTKKGEAGNATATSGSGGGKKTEAKPEKTGFTFGFDQPDEAKKGFAFGFGAPDAGAGDDSSSRGAAAGDEAEEPEIESFPAEEESTAAKAKALKNKKAKERKKKNKKAKAGGGDGTAGTSQSLGTPRCHSRPVQSEPTVVCAALLRILQLNRRKGYMGRMRRRRPPRPWRRRRPSLPRSQRRAERRRASRTAS
jgi:hypothetical protein